MGVNNIAKSHGHIRKVSIYLSILRVVHGTLVDMSVIDGLQCVSKFKLFMFSPNIRYQEWNCQEKTGRFT
jgi:hypothetical protein